MFEDRKNAGFLLAKKLENYAGKKNVLILGMARGGVAVAKVISTFLNCSLDVLVVKKIGSPQNDELAIGGLAPNTVFWNEDLIKSLNISDEEKNRLEELKENERKEQEMALRGDKPLEIFGKTVILVDDGVATGASVIVAALFLKEKKVAKIILAVPVIAKDILGNIKRYFDSIVFLKSVGDFHAVGQFYKHFPQVENEEVIELLR